MLGSVQRLKWLPTTSQPHCLRCSPNLTASRCGAIILLGLPCTRKTSHPSPHISERKQSNDSRWPSGLTVAAPKHGTVLKQQRYHLAALHAGLSGRIRRDARCQHGPVACNSVGSGGRARGVCGFVLPPLPVRHRRFGTRECRLSRSRAVGECVDWQVARGSDEFCWVCREDCTPLCHATLAVQWVGLLCAGLALCPNVLLDFFSKNKKNLKLDKDLPVQCSSLRWSL